MMSEGLSSFFSLQQAEILSSVSPDYQSSQISVIANQKSGFKNLCLILMTSEDSDICGSLFDIIEDVRKFHPDPFCALQCNLNLILDIFILQLTQLADNVAKAISELPSADAPMKCVEPLFFQDLLPAPIPGSATIRFVPPSRTAFHLIGSVPLRTVCLTDTTDDSNVIELAMVVPKASFQQKDYLDYRYYVKRCAYLWHVKEQLMQQSYQCKWSTESPANGQFVGRDSLKPYIQISVASTDAVVYLIPVVEPEIFPFAKLNPSRRNIRKGSNGPSPSYNQGILEDMLLLSHISLFKEVFEKDCPVLSQAVTLLKAWIRRRGVIGANDWVLATLCVLWYKHGKLSANASASQVLRNILDLLGKMFGDSESGASSIFGPLQKSSKGRKPSIKGREGGIRDCRESWEKFPSPTPLQAALIPGSEIPEDMAKQFKIVVMCPMAKLNMLWRLSLGALRALSIEARIATKTIQAGDASALADHFLSSRSSTLLQFDVHWKVCVKSSVHGWFLEHWRKNVETVLTRALGDRAQAVVLTREFDGGVLVSAILQPDKAFRLVDMSPSPEDLPERAEQFKAFWGRKLSQLRRFQDGQVREAVVWKPESRDKPERVQAHVLFTHVPTTVLGLHLDPPPTHVEVIADNFDKWTAIADGNTEDEFSDLWESYQQLAKMIRQLNHITSEKELPLNVVAVYPLGQALRRTSVLVAKKGEMNNFPIWYPCVEIALALEGSGNWPKLPDAEKFTGAAFLLAIARKIQKEYSKVICTASLDCLDICLNGRIFRCRVMCPSDDLIKRKSFHATSIQGVITRFRAMNATCRLAERFMRSHFFSDSFMPPEAVELIVASLFTQRAPAISPTEPVKDQETREGWGDEFAPSSGFRGFLSFLNLIESFPWEAQPLIVDPVNELAKEDCIAIEEEFQKQGHLLSVASCTPKKRRSLNHSLSKSDLSSKNELKRMRIYAKTALDTIGQFPEAAPSDVKVHHVANPIRQFMKSCRTISTKSLSNEFEVLYSNANGVNLSKSLSKPLKNCRDIVVDEDFVSKFADELRALVTKDKSLVQMVFHDKYGSNVIGLKLKNVMSGKTEEHRQSLKSEFSELTETIALEGYGMVSKILVKKSVLNQFGVRTDAKRS